MVHADLGQQAPEAEPDGGGACALPEVRVDHENPVGGPAQGAGMLSQGVLADVDRGQLGPMGVGDLPGLDRKIAVAVAS